MILDISDSTEVFEDCPTPNWRCLLQNYHTIYKEKERSDRTYRGKCWEEEKVFLFNIANIDPHLKILKGNSASDNLLFRYSNLYRLVFLSERILSIDFKLCS